MVSLRASTLAFALMMATANATGRSNERTLAVQNRSGGKIEVHWVHSVTGELSRVSNPHVFSGAAMPLNTYIGHEFEIKEVPSAVTGLCKSPDQVCRTARFKVTENDNQVATVDDNIQVQFVDNKIQAQQSAKQVIEECKERINVNETAVKASKEGGATILDDLLECVESRVTDKFVEANEEIAFQASIRKSIAGQMENLTCTNPNEETSNPIEVKSWAGAKDGRRRKVNILHDRPSSKIHVIENFVSASECQAIEEAAKPKLHYATVADGKGGSHYSDHRRAMQAGVRVNWANESRGDPIAKVTRRIYDYTEHILKLGIKEPGQEDLMSIQYFGRGTNDTAPDRYTPHCDGDCDGLKHKTGTRMATMVMYCTIPEIGGHTNFRNAGVHVKPVVGSAIFFSYINPKTLIKDDGFTEHSGCPVFAGNKKIAVHWVRLGVDAVNRWDTFNTLGVKHSDE